MSDKSLRIAVAVAVLIIASLAATFAEAATEQEFDFECAVTASMELGANAPGSDGRYQALRVYFFYLGRLSGRDSETHWSALVREKLAEPRDKDELTVMYGRCLAFLNKQLEW
jgi:hypothetical protein